MASEYNDTEVGVFRPRASRPKVRTGCAVCKTRRVKCDEQKPDCNRCKSTGRKCEYVQLPLSRIFPRLEENVSVPSNQLTICPGATYKEGRSLDYFRSHAVLDISGYFDIDFWERLVPQFCLAEPAVRHSLVALSFLHEARGRANVNVLQQYNTAIGLLASRSASSVQTTLLSCVIFIWIEMLRNEHDAALKHLSSGLQILEQCTESLDEVLPRILSRLKAQASITCGFDPKSTWTYFPLPAPFFSSLPEARSALDIELNAIFPFMREPRDLEKRAYHMHNLEQWSTAFQSMLHHSFHENESAAVCLLQLHHRMAHMTLRWLYNTCQMVYDDCTEDFNDMIWWASCLIQHQTTLITSFDMGVILPLLFVVMKCRDYEIRTKAVALLKQAPEREGMWQRDTVVRVCEWKVEKEEAGRGGLPEIPESARTHQESVRLVGKKVIRMRYTLGPGVDVNGREEMITGLDMSPPFTTLMDMHQCTNKWWKPSTPTDLDILIDFQAKVTV